eukprot:TRINITY_DN725_c0_g1_i4.p1 TRINITY_DN725_c0_g1~~TRINITY_DN725_c0_g1_i4.p1  ORF type:complete len:146 (+),score=21.47 TRINITY_DN725_c0_g1_i4:262-699(+)
MYVHGFSSKRRHSYDMAWTYGAVIVSTPQDLALIDAKRGIDMFQKVSVPILGLIENMSFFVCPKCSTISEVFGRHGAKETASHLNVPFLGEIPLDMDIRKTTDEGKPIVISIPSSVGAQAYIEIAKKILGNLDSEDVKGPKIIIE